TIRENNRETLLTVNRFRKDLFIENKYDGCDGFHYLFEQPLKSRENQNIRVYANSFSFPKSNSEIVIDTAEGILGVIFPSIITGWAINQTNEIAVDLIIKINDELLCEIKADGDRPDIKKLGMHETGKCGFSVRNFDSHVIRAGTKIEAIVKETGQHLKNSPYVIPSKLSDSISYKPLLFLHIPKTAGTSFRTALQEIYSKKETLQDYGDKSSETSHIIIKEAENRGVLIPYMIENKTAFITGHFHARKYLALLKDDVQWCTFLRDPIDRVLSEYNHLVANNTYHVSFTAFYRQHPQINRQTKLMSGLSLEEFFFIGITEEYTLSIKLFNYLTNSNIPSLELNINRNKNKTVSNSLDKETLKELKNLNAKDYKLYELAKKNLQKTCKNLGIH
ncbi:MAG: sulfotransferase family 2 domain-containing protein, partial [Campylobacterota bacterium]|nr:sulfotransferase family 2 domain-containing protein [Campylobacterota bacterium]